MDLAGNFQTELETVQGEEGRGADCGIYIRRTSCKGLHSPHS